MDRKFKSIIEKEGKVSIPKRIRSIYGFRIGESVRFSIEGEKIVLEREEDPLEAYLKEIPNKKVEPEHIDWDREYYSQFGE